MYLSEVEIGDLVRRESKTSLYNFTILTNLVLFRVFDSEYIVPGLGSCQPIKKGKIINNRYLKEVIFLEIPNKVPTVISNFFNDISILRCVITLWALVCVQVALLVREVSAKLCQNGSLRDVQPWIYGLLISNDFHRMKIISNSCVTA